MSQLKQAAGEYRRGLFFIDGAFREAQEQLGPSVPCGRGCSRCCAALFDIHPADALLLGTWLDEQPVEVRNDVVRKAGVMVGRVERAARRLERAGHPGIGGWLPEQGFRLLDAETIMDLTTEVEGGCPILDSEGACRAHASRPAICRLQGLPWADVHSGDVLPDYCRLDPRQESNPPQPLDLARLDGLRETVGEAALAAGEAAGRVGRGRTFISEALVRWAKASGGPS